MQTFLPYPEFDLSAKCLDRQRLGKQRIEVLQILKALHEGGGWANHPAVKMWQGYEHTLISYGLHICNEWIGRGYKDSCWGKINSYRSVFKPNKDKPWWLGDAAFHASHRSNLLRKNWYFYWVYRWKEPPNLEYLWPVK